MSRDERYLLPSDLVGVGEACVKAMASGLAVRFVASWAPNPFTLRITSWTSEPPKLCIEWPHDNQMELSASATREARPDEWDTTCPCDLGQLLVELEISNGQRSERVPLAHPIVAALKKLGVAATMYSRTEAVVAVGQLEGAIERVLGRSSIGPGCVELL